ncbi:hypothetical protein ABK249_14495 [Neorhizobium sp. Rsf11]|uniref:Uncharacterized protein n=1 Tax=Neorhizobium phenanthreniclasticum TaxID=3157917 RepID=A0ABV0M2S4_9HYPH
MAAFLFAAAKTAKPSPIFTQSADGAPLPTTDELAAIKSRRYSFVVGRSRDARFFLGLRIPPLFLSIADFGKHTGNTTMTLPSLWRQAAFSVAESADLLRVPEDTLRTWMARCPFNDFMGSKTGGRIFLSGNDLYFWSIVRDLSAFGVGLRIAMLSVQPIANEAAYDLPGGDLLVVQMKERGVWSFERTASPDVTCASSVIIPLHEVAIDLIGRAAAVYAKDGE